jgi:hypothetical protein
MFVGGVIQAVPLTCCCLQSVHKVRRVADCCQCGVARHSSARRDKERKREADLELVNRRAPLPNHTWARRPKEYTDTDKPLQTLKFYEGTEFCLWNKRLPRNGAVLQDCFKRRMRRALQPAIHQGNLKSVMPGQVHSEEPNGFSHY